LEKIASGCFIRMMNGKSGTLSRSAKIKESVLFDI
jgi:hypothetical protein